MDRHRRLAAAVLVTATLAACSSGGASGSTRSATTSASADGSTTAASTSTTPTPATVPSTTTAAPTNTPRTTSAVPSASSSTDAGRSSSTVRTLPVTGSTGIARQVITVAAASTSSTTATLQAWIKVSGGWRRSGPSVTAHLGADGLSRTPSESRSATPIGSFTLTQAFGHDNDPGTRLPYVRTTPADWWISQPGPLYNTRQRCSSGCSFTRGDPNEHLYYETPFYDYAVVIDYNTRNAPGGIRQGAGSAFFLHVTVDPTTQGCVSVPADQLVRLLRWLDPARHPRIVIGVR